MVNLVADVVSLRNEGRISADALTARLERQDLEILETKIMPSTWYPISTYRRLTELLMESWALRAPARLVKAFEAGTSQS